LKRLLNEVDYRDKLNHNSKPLNEVLKNYQLTASNSLAGPSQSTLPPSTTRPSPPSPPRTSSLNVEVHTKVPLIVPADESRCQYGETLLDGEVISCFVISGEKHLCLPQILNTVLKNFSLQEINGVCEELLINCSRCTPEQLAILKRLEILPASAPSCGLITKPDAERLVAALVDARPLTLECLLKFWDDSRGSLEGEVMKKSVSIVVYHESFGRKTQGIYLPTFYQTSTSPCIRCVECSGFFCPQKFVCHTHNRNSRTCHWGFDSSNWRHYILLSPDQSIANNSFTNHSFPLKKSHSRSVFGCCAPPEERKVQQELDILLDDMKRRFDISSLYRFAQTCSSTVAKLHPPSTPLNMKGQQSQSEVEDRLEKWSSREFAYSFPLHYPKIGQEKLDILVDVRKRFDVSSLFRFSQTCSSEANGKSSLSSPTLKRKASLALSENGRLADDDGAENFLYKRKLHIQ